MRSIEEIDAKIAQYKTVVRDDENKIILIEFIADLAGLLYYPIILLIPFLLLDFAPIENAFKIVIIPLAVLGVFIIFVCKRIILYFEKKIIRRSEARTSLMEAKGILSNEKGDLTLYNKIDDLISARKMKPGFFARRITWKDWVRHEARIAAYSWVTSDKPEPEE